MKNKKRDSQAMIRAGAALLVVVLGLSACGTSIEQRLQKADSALTQGHFRTAEIQLKNVLQKAPKNADAWLMLGRVSLATSQYADAVEQFKRARAAGTPAARVKTLLARALLGNGQDAKVIALLKSDAKSQAAQGQADADNKAEAARLVLLGDAYAHRQKFQAAADAFAKALKKRSNFAPALVGQARLAEQGQKSEAAQRLLDRALRADPSYAPARLARGRFAYNKNRCKAAIPALKKAVNAPTKALPLDRRFMARAYLADCLMRGNKFEAARPQIDKLMTGAPDNAYANYLQALLNFNDKDYKQATVHLQRVLKNAPNQRNALTLFGLVKIAQNDPQLAEIYLNQAVHQRPLNIVALRLLASLYLQQNQPDRAVALLQDAHADHKNNAIITAMLSTALVRAGKTGPALQAMQGSAKAMSVRPDLQFNVARVFASAGDTAAAAALVNQVKPKNKNGRLQSAQIKIRLALQQKQPDKALAAARALVQSEPHDAVAKRVLASTFVAVGQPDKARSLLQDIVDAHPQDAITRLDLGLLALREHNYRRADGLFHDVLKQRPKQTNAMLGLARSAGLQGNTDAEIGWLDKAHRAAPKALGPALALVQARLANGSAQQAVPVIQKLVTQHPSNAAAERLAGVVLLAAGNQNKALGRFKQAVALAPNEPTYRLDLARAQLAVDGVDNAIKTLRSLRKTHPDFLAAAPMLAMAELRAGHPDAALADAHRLSKQANGKTASAVLEGNVLASQGKYRAAITAYARAYRAKPSAAVALSLFRARRRANAARPAASLADWVSRHPKDARIRLVLAQWQQSQGELGPAQKQYEHVLKIAPDSAVALNNLALLYAQRGNDDRALATAKKAYASQPKNPAVMDTLGWLQVQRGNVKSGLPLLQKAANSAGSGPDIQYHLAAALAKTGKQHNITKAKKLLQQALGQKQPFDSRSEAKRLSQKLVQNTATANG